MLNLYSLESKSEPGQSILTNLEKFSLLYHNLFDYPLNLADLIKWLPAEGSTLSNPNDPQVSSQSGYFYLTGREGLIYKRLLRKRISAKKLEIARRAARILSFVPGVKMVAVTGSLAMQNSTDDSDIDLMIVTKGGRLWTTRLLSYLLLKITNHTLRSPMDKHQKDKLCLNMWLDESDLIWKKSDRNLYTSHEIAQIIPLINKNKTYERFLFQNKWILNFWPNSLKGSDLNKPLSFLKRPDPFKQFVNKLAFKIQYQYMKSKITRETITPTRALFHPQDWGQIVFKRLNS